MSEIVGLAIIAIFPVCMVFATFFDIFTMTIPNKLTLILFAAFIILAPLAGMEWLQMAKHFGVAAIVLGVCFFFFAMGWMGAGDAKLLTVSGQRQETTENAAEEHVDQH
ncbi:MAG: prepilin peptidase, partial [Pseudomonadota bacterium]